ncbi:MAG: glycine--tRNA ligase subunit beta [Legionellales bacterium]
MVNDFIFELGCEELPSGFVFPLADAFSKHMLAALDKAQLTYGTVRLFASPRRMALQICDLQEEQGDQHTSRRGPAVIAAYDKEGKPTPALLGFAKSCGVEPEQLKTIATDKGDWIIHDSLTPGAKTKELLAGMVSDSLAALAIAKPMRWGNSDEAFARPVHWAVLLYGTEIIRHTLLGIQTSDQSRGHRFHHPDSITIASAKEYEQVLLDAYVVADFSKRRQLIRDQVEILAASVQAVAVMPEELLDEVTSIVEWPVALIAGFEPEFLDVPSEALIASMQIHQKCFALRTKEGALLPYFITVANIVSTKPEQVVLGNEKVMRARLSDAAFFFRQDKKQALSHHIPATEQVVFQVKLGSLQAKALRMKALMPHLAQSLNLSQSQAERAAVLSKCDLMTGMVGEFPELQGLMGYYYALHDGEDRVVAQALNEQYMPRFAADSLPQSDLGLALSLADRLDTLVGIFAIGQRPSGVKDPFKLRRHALAVVRLLVSTPAAMSLKTVIDQAIMHFGRVIPENPALNQELKSFILERMASYYQGQGISGDLVLAVRARQEDWLYDLDKRLNALKLFVSQPEAVSLSAACKRVSNLITQAGGSHSTAIINPDLIEAGAEQSLYDSIQSLSKQVSSLYSSADYGAVLQHLATLKEPVDAFFDNVMVLVDEVALRNNRLTLLAGLQDLLQGVADISLLQLGAISAS